MQKVKRIQTIPWEVVYHMDTPRAWPPQIETRSESNIILRDLQGFKAFEQHTKNTLSVHNAP